MKIDDLVLLVELLCADCGARLNVTSPMPAKAVYDDWTQLVMSGGFVAGKCAAGCRSTFSDLNINTTIKIVLKDDESIEVKFGAIKVALGHTYHDDPTCSCGEVLKERLIEGKYGAGHMACGKKRVA